MKKICVVFLLLLSGCSSQFAYNNLDWLVHWYLDDYIDLNKPQKIAFDERFAQWHDWHRGAELENYVRHLQDLKRMLQEGNITSEMVSGQFNRARDHWLRLREHVAPDIVSLAQLLNDKQVEELFASLEEKNAADEIERKEKSQEELTERFQKRFKEQLQDYFGRLTQEQKALVAKYAQQVIPNRLEWLTYRRAVQSAAKELLMQRDLDSFEQDFLSLVTQPEIHQHPQYIANLEHNRGVFSDLVVEVFPTITEKQKRRLYRKIDNYIDDFSELSQDG
ncbi:DUF6279 family lipoprotein [Planctobacterium marinum]|uniref:Lipoprotein n=1 Tax=Planctobacterium marinum TaxID=1631968 RepID=A0AA48HVS9_9ALTE|nr:hypothetical protein MACH26_22840 [Planctobacterium marinum]